MFERLERSWNLVKFSFSILEKDKELLVFPILSSVAAMLVLASFFPLLLADATMADPGNGQPVTDAVNYPLLFVIYLCEYFVVFFFNSALVAAALERIGGGDPTVKSGLRVAWRKVGVIFFYSMIAATVGTERGGLFGRLFSGISGMLWTLASFLAVPILVSRNVGPIDALTESVRLLRHTWGENIIVNAGMGIVFGVIYFAVGIVMAMLLMLTASSGGAAAALTIGGIFLVGFVLLGLVHATLQGIFSAALYHYAVDGDDDAGIPAEVLGSAFAQR
jgi:hypothetical protein